MVVKLHNYRSAPTDPLKRSSYMGAYPGVSACLGYYGRYNNNIILNTGQIGLEWEVVGVANNSQRGTSERVKEKMLKMSEVATAAIDNGAERRRYVILEPCKFIVLI